MVWYGLVFYFFLSRLFGSGWLGLVCYGIVLFFYFCSLHESSSWVELRLHAKSQLPSFFGSCLVWFGMVWYGFVFVFFSS